MIDARVNFLGTLRVGENEVKGSLKTLLAGARYVRTTFSLTLAFSFAENNYPRSQGVAADTSSAPLTSSVRSKNS